MGTVGTPHCLSPSPCPVPRGEATQGWQNSPLGQRTTASWRRHKQEEEVKAQPVTEGPPGAHGAAEPTRCLLPLPKGHPGMHRPREGC